jgi:uncharacterized membrane protein (UPF0127 family)
MFFSACKRRASVVLINDIQLEIEVADTPEKMRKGLMFRESLPENCGMLFIMPAVRRLTLWMRNTTIPLSAGFISEDGVITEIIDMEPLDETLRPSRSKIKYAIEVNQGWFDRNGIKVGDKVEIPFFQ